MTKRRLSKQQKLRIQQRREVQSELRDHEEPLGEEQEGVVISQFRHQADVQPSDGRPLLRCHLRANLGPIVAGDRVIWQTGEQSHVVTAVFPRTTVLTRPDSYGKLKLIAANIDRMLITIAPEPAAHGNLIDRYLLLAASIGLEVAILLNKADLIQTNSGCTELLQQYRQLNFPVFTVCAKDESSLETLKTYLSDATSIFVGQSGVGKSSIIQTLLPDEPIKIGKLSEQVKKGRHTTTHARLYNFPFGGHCIDSPGIRELGLWHLTEDQVILGFPEFQPFVEQCRFRNCSHNKEPGCALQEARMRGEISEERFSSYRLIMDTLNDVDVSKHDKT